MAESLTQEERAKVRFYLGYPNLEARHLYGSGYLLVAPTGLVLENNMRSIVDTFAIELIRDLLDQVETSRANITKALKRLKFQEIAYTIKANPYEVQQLWEEDYKLCRQLAQQLGSPIIQHPSGLHGSQGGSISFAGE